MREAFQDLGMAPRACHALGILLVFASVGWGEGAPKILNGIGIDQNLNAQVPAELMFKDETGRDVRLGDYFGRKPIILTLVYYRCPMLCTMVLNDLARSMNGMEMSGGKDFEIVTVSFDPRETPELAAAKKQQYLDDYRRPTAATGWHFLTGPAPSIDALTKTVGFHYTWDPQFNQYVHASGIMVLTPQGKIARYFYGIDYAPSDLRLSLVEASNEQIGSPADQLLLYCFHYDPSTGKYGLVIMNLLRALGVLTLAIVGGGIFLMLLRDRGGRLAKVETRAGD